LTTTAGWLTAALGVAPKDMALYSLALTHGSHGTDSYQRLEFLGDRVLGLVIALWLYERFPDDAEGQLSRRLNALVSGVTCAQVARAIDVAPHLKLGKQARDDGAWDSDNVLGDVIEALIGALLLDHGMDAAQSFIKSCWNDLLDIQVSAPRHPKSELQEWAAAHGRRPPIYEITERSGPHHAPHFTIKVSLGSAGEAIGEGSSKQEAETAAAAAMLGQLGE
jgi:ribonuclease III